MNNDGGHQYLYRTNTSSGNPIPEGLWLSSESFISSHNTPSSLAQTWMYYYEAPMILASEKREEGAEYWYAYFNQK